MRTRSARYWRGALGSAAVRWDCQFGDSSCEVEPRQLVDAAKHGFLAIPFAEEKHLLEAFRFKGANQCNTMIAGAYGTAGRSTEKILAAMEEAACKLGGDVRAKSDQKEEW